MAPPPRTRMPSGFTPEAQPTPVEDEPLAPAPNNGVPFAEQVQADAEKKEKKKHPPHRGRQLGLRISEDLYERLEACAKDSRIPKTRLLERGLDAELKSHGF